MDIYLYDNKNKDFIKFPVVPESISIDSIQKMETFESLGQGDLKILGLMGNRKFDLNSFFPVNDYPFLKDRTFRGMEYINKIENWRLTREPLIILISDLNINFKCVIENLTYTIQDGSGDIYYKLSIEEYKVPVIKKTTVQQTKIVTSPQNQNVSQPSTTIDYLENSYGIVTAPSGLNVRTGNGIGYEKLGTLSYNEKVKLFRLEGDWWHIYYPPHGGHVSAEWIRRI